jgi:ArsR family transcriptional regulator
MKPSDTARIFKALACEQRIRVLELLKQWGGFGACCEGVTRAFTKASEELNISRSTLSHHFKELENAGLIVCERDGKSFNCRINEKVIKLVREFLKG